MDVEVKLKSPSRTPVEMQHSLAIMPARPLTDLSLATVTNCLRYKLFSEQWLMKVQAMEDLKVFAAQRAAMEWKT